MKIAQLIQEMAWLMTIIILTIGVHWSFGLLLLYLIYKQIKGV